MVDINKKEKNIPGKIQDVEPVAPTIPESGIEIPQPEPIVEQSIQPKEQSIEAEKKIEQAKEQISEIPEAATSARPAPVSPIMKDEEILTDLQDVMTMDKPKQIKVLVYLAFKKGIHHAAKIAKQLKDPYIMDEFHDTLVDELYSLLLQKKKLKQK